MGLFTRLNARILAAIDKRSGTMRLVRAAIVDNQLVLTQSDGSLQQLNWSALKRVVAVLRDLYAGSQVSLLLEFSDSQVSEVPESCPGWFDLCEAIALLGGAHPFGEWYEQAQRSRAGQAIEVWSDVK
jgi:hypothetical protein